VKKKDLYKWVDRLYELGLTPIPISKNSKTPNGFSKGELTSYHFKRPSKEKIDEWKEKGLYENVGILLGKAHGNIICFDFDNPKAFDSLNLDPMKVVQDGGWVVKTPREEGRYHIYLLGVDEVDVTRETSHGVEFRGNQHYTLFYPSIHPNGNSYNLLNTLNPDELELPAKKDVISLWTKWKETFDEKLTEDEVGQHIRPRKEFDRSPECIKSAWEKGAPNGERKMTIIGLSNWLREYTFPQEMTESIILDWFRNKCDTKGMKISEVMEAVKAGYEDKYNYGCRYWRCNTEFCPFKTQTDCPWYQPDVKSKRELLERYDAIELSKDGTIKKVIPYNVARMLMEEHDYNFTVIRDEKSDREEIFYYKDGYYHRNGILMIRKLINYYLEEMSSEYYKREIIGTMSDFNNKSRAELEPPLHLINVKNGIYNIRTGELIPHSKEYYFINQIPIEYNPKAKCPKFNKFVSEVVYEKQIPLIQEMFGFTFYREYFIHVAFMLVGGGRNGKGVLVNILERLLGSQNVSTEPLEDLTSRPYASAELYGRMLNIGSEISDSELKNSNKFKILTGNEPIKGEVKYGATFSFRNYAKLIFNTNQIPYSRDHTYGFKQRWIIIPFPNTFPRGAKGTDPFVERRIVEDEEEMQGIFNWAMEGLKRLMNKYDFTYEASNQYENMINPGKKFILDNLTLQYGNVLSRNEIYNKYRIFCEENLYFIETEEIFFDKVKYYFPEIDTGRFVIDGNRISGFRDIGWKEDE